MTRISAAPSNKQARPAALKNPAAVPRPNIFKLGKDGLPLLKVAAPLARRLQQICASLIAEELAGSGIVQLEFAALRFVADMPGIEQWRLADAIGIDRNSASLVSDVLERKGLLDRRVNGADRRARELYLTSKGGQTFEALLPKIRAANDRILSPLSRRDQKLFIDLLAQLVEGNSVHAVPGAGRRKRGVNRTPAKGDRR